MLSTQIYREDASYIDCVCSIYQMLWYNSDEAAVHLDLFIWHTYLLHCHLIGDWIVSFYPKRPQKLSLQFMLLWLSPLYIDPLAYTQCPRLNFV